MTGTGRATRWVLAGLLLVAIPAAGTVLALRLARPPAPTSKDIPPPPNGYFGLRPVGSYASLPSDPQAAAKVDSSTWEPRPQNAPYNHRMPAHLRLRPVKVSEHAYDPRWNKYIIGRITGHFAGTTDEIFQWAAAKWGLPDNILRTVAYMESDWHQSNYGDFTYDRAKCPARHMRLPCPVTFGIVGTKSTDWAGVYPWNRASTAAAVDVLGGWLRGCYEGWVWWLRQHGNRTRGAYRAGDIWGCVGAWFSGDWHDGPADGNGGQNYIIRAQYWLEIKPWLRRGF